eukprot:3504545-Heterocapsa_arctica.AAC.1
MIQKARQSRINTNESTIPNPTRNSWTRGSGWFPGGSDLSHRPASRHGPGIRHELSPSKALK